MNDSPLQSSMITLNVGQKGEIVIPKKIRETIGIVAGGTVKMTMQGKTIEIKTAADDPIERMRQRAAKYNIPAGEIVMGNSLYEEEFDVH